MLSLFQHPSVTFGLLDLLMFAQPLVLIGLIVWSFRFSKHVRKRFESQHVLLGQDALERLGHDVHEVIPYSDIRKVHSLRDRKGAIIGLQLETNSKNYAFAQFTDMDVLVSHLEARTPSLKRNEKTSLLNSHRSLNFIILMVVCMLAGVGLTFLFQPSQALANFLQVAWLLGFGIVVLVRRPTSNGLGEKHDSRSIAKGNIILGLMLLGLAIWMLFI